MYSPCTLFELNNRCCVILWLVFFNFSSGSAETGAETSREKKIYGSEKGTTFFSIFTYFFKLLQFKRTVILLVMNYMHLQLIGNNSNGSLISSGIKNVFIVINCYIALNIQEFSSI